MTHNSQENHFIEIENVTHYYQYNVPAIEKINMKVKKGEFVCILGPSGCGKSTLMTILSGLMLNSEGRVKVNGQDVYANGKIAYQPHVGYVFQEHRLLPWKTVEQNIIFAMKAMGIPKEKWASTLDQYLSMLQIKQFRNSWPLNLSGGQRQRVSIARALATDPEFILMDEPFSGLDEVTARFMREELLGIWKRTEKTIIFVTHSIREAIYLADRIFIFTKSPGKIYKVLDIDVLRPRRYEDLSLAEIEAEIVNDVLVHWGMEAQIKQEKQLLAELNG